MQPLDQVRRGVQIDYKRQLAVGSTEKPAPLGELLSKSCLRFATLAAKRKRVLDTTTTESVFTSARRLDKIGKYSLAAARATRGAHAPRLHCFKTRACPGGTLPGAP